MSDGIKRLHVPGIDADGAPYSHIVMDDRYAFVAGVVASDVPGGAASHGDIAAETRVVMAAIRDALAHVGLGLDRIVRVDVHLTDVTRMPELNAAYTIFFAPGALPTRTCTESRALAGGSNVEITVMARLLD